MEYNVEICLLLATAAAQYLMSGFQSWDIIGSMKFQTYLLAALGYISSFVYLHVTFVIPVLHSALLNVYKKA